MRQQLRRTFGVEGGGSGLLGLNFHMSYQMSGIEEKVLTLQSRAYFLASIIAAFLSRSNSNVKTNERPFLACQNNALAALLPSPLTPQS